MLTPLAETNLPRRLVRVTVLSAVLLLTWVCIGSPSAQAQSLLPPAGQIFQGTSGQPISAYEQAAGKHPAVYQIFSAWGEWLPGMFADAAAARARLMIHITTASGNREMITPAQIAAGDGDGWLIALNGAIAAAGRPVYVRLMAEMDNANNPYSAYNADGSFRGAGHSPAAYIRAWRRVTLILRGGTRATIDARLARLRMPPLRASGDLPLTRVAMLWVPMTGGSPDIPGNQPRDYWPGRAWVDWVGTDFYSKFPNFAGLDAFSHEFPGLPFVFGEYAMWGSDDAAFITRLFGWITHHRQVRMVVYNQGMALDGPFRLSHYPAAAAALRAALASPRYPAFAPEWLVGSSTSARTGRSPARTSRSQPG
jgi:hypothetical protein